MLNTLGSRLTVCFFGICILAAAGLVYLMDREGREVAQMQAPPGGSVKVLPEKRAAAPGTPTVTKVTVVSPERKTIRRVVEQPAHIDAYEVTPLFAKAAGYVQQVSFEIGDMVRGPKYDKGGKLTDPGQALVQLSLPEVDDEVRQKEALVAQAEAQADQARSAIKVAEAMVATSRARVSETQASIKRAAALYEKYQSEMNRFVELQAKAAVTQKLVDEAREQVAAADAARQEAAAKLESAMAFVKENEANLEKAKADAVAAEAHVQVAKADLARVKTLLAYGTVRAPFDGVVTRRNVHTGHLVSAGITGEPLLEVVRIDIVRIYIDVPESDAGLVEPGDAVTIRLPAQAGAVLTGKVTRISWSLDAAARTLHAEVQVTNEGGKLRPGMYAYASIVAAEHVDAVVLPASAVIIDKTDTYCLCVEGGKIVRKTITLGLRNTGEVEVATGLNGDEKVVRANPASLTIGQAVEASPYQPPKQ
jgi:HlyD family secretion protein